jgi:hypothetical protein
MSVCFGRTTQNSFPSGVGQDGPGFSAGLPDAAPARPEGKKAAGLLLAVGGAAGQAGLHAVLDHLAIGHWQETPAGRRVLVGPMTIARSRPERILQPSAWGPEPGPVQAGRACRGHAGRHATRNRDG